MPISDQNLHRFAQRTFAIGLLVISSGAVLQLTQAHQSFGLDPAAYGNATIFGLLARVGGTIALIGLLGFGLRAAQRPARNSAELPSFVPDNQVTLSAQGPRGDSAPTPRLPSRIRPVRIAPQRNSPQRVEHSG